MEEWKPGLVLLWNAYETPDDLNSVIKPFWFLLLGDTGRIQSPLGLFFAKATTQLHYYAPGGLRSTNIVYRFSDYLSYGFTQECLIDFSYPPIEKEASHVRNKIQSGQIILKGTLEQGKLKAIYDLIIRSRMYSNIQKNHIKNSLNREGINGLPAHRRPRRRY